MLIQARGTDLDVFERLLHSDFSEIGASGVRFGKAECLERMAHAQPVEFTIDEWEVRRLQSRIVQTVYRSRLGSVASRRSSVWVLSDGRWQMWFHQGTPSPGR